MSRKRAPSCAHEETLVCHQGEVLAFRLRPAHPAADAPAALHVRRMAFDAGSGTFVPRSAATFRFREEENMSALQVARCGRVSDFRVGLELPYAMMRTRGDGSAALRFLLLLLHADDTFETRLSFTLDREFEDSVRVLGGPSVLWRRGDALCLLSSASARVVGVPDVTARVLWAGEVADVGAVLLGRRGDGDLCFYALDRRETLRGACAVPAAYRDVTHARVCAAEVLGDRLRVSLLALTASGRLVWLRDGAPTRVCRLPPGRARAVQPLDAGDGKRFFVVSLDAGQACAVCGSSFQVAAAWGDVHAVLVDDFVGRGTEQVLLLLRNGSNSDRLASFVLTDLGDIHYSSEAPGLGEEDGARDSRRLLIPPLRAALQVGAAAVGGLRRQLALKDKVLARSFAALLSLVHGKDGRAPRTQQVKLMVSTLKEAGLVPLWGEDEHRVPSSEPRDPPGGCRGCTRPVEKTWYRVLDDKLVVGVQTAPAWEASGRALTLSLLVDRTHGAGSRPVRCRTRLIRLSARSGPAAHGMPPRAGGDANAATWACPAEPQQTSDGRRAPGRRSARLVTALTSLPPLLALRRCRCTLLLHVGEGGPDDRARDRYVLCGRLGLDLEDVAHGTHVMTFPEKTRLDGVEDLGALLAATRRSCFRVTSPDYVLNVVHEWLSDRMQCDVVPDSPDLRFCRRPGSFYGTVFRWRQTSPFQGLLTVHSRNRTVLLQCLHDLVRRLPVRTFLGRVDSERDDELVINRLAWTVEQELRALDALPPVLARLEGDFLRSCEDPERDVYLCRRELRRTPGTFRNADGGPWFRNMLLQAARWQLQSDLAAQKLTHA
ncbi:Fanconi anemia group B protein-like [Ochotona princeps]|uniref:Fanconi anemia group B protein-like n=1 Tax=Ochotona princeps TaxID=9978 RepID=UPI0027151F00|nr:Fanconi anemia group B protein-like [Ochotona princeps]